MAWSDTEHASLVPCVLELEEPENTPPPTIASRFLGVGELGVEEKLFRKIPFYSEKPIKDALCSVLLLSPLQMKSSDFHIADLCAMFMN